VGVVRSQTATRTAHGEDSHLARVTSKQVLLMPKLYATNDVTQTALAERFDIKREGTSRADTIGEVFL
jgi:hypothetical protein